MAKRRRAFKASKSKDYDRSADRPEFVSAFDADGDRVVPLEDSAEGTGDEGSIEDLDRLEFYKEQRPPHHG